ncbi:MAG: SRPBCC family protein [Calditrichia bacterium]
MKKLITVKIALVLLFILLVLFLIIGIFLPPVVKVERTIAIAAPSSSIYKLISNFRRWPEWAAPMKGNSGMIHVFEGLDSAPGSVYKWREKDGSRSGTLTMVAVDSGRGIWYKISLNGGALQGNCSLLYQLKDSTTNMRWQFESNLGGNVFRKYKEVSLLPFIKKDIEDGLKNLKKLAEQDSSATDSVNYEPPF